MNCCLIRSIPLLISLQLIVQIVLFYYCCACLGLNYIFVHYIRAAEFMIYRLKEMGKICKEDITAIMEQLLYENRFLILTKSIQHEKTNYPLHRCSVHAKPILFYINRPPHSSEPTLNLILNLSFPQTAIIKIPTVWHPKTQFQTSSCPN